MWRSIFFLLPLGLVLSPGCGSDGGSDTGAVVSACESYCEAAFAEPCGEIQLTVSQCKAQCAYYVQQLLGVCESETGAAFECVAKGGIECTGYDTDGDGVDDTFAPTPIDPCIEEQQAQLACEQTAGCKRFCNAAEESGCGGDCVASCEARQSEVGECEYQYNNFVSCGSRFEVTCEGGQPTPSVECADEAFSAGECVTPGDYCAAYCFGSEELSCGGASCAEDCAARLGDVECGSTWNQLLDCMIFFGDAECEGGALIPTADGICSFERDDYLSCAGSF